MGGYLIFRDGLFAWKLKLQESNQTYHFRTEITPLKATERVTRLVFVFYEIGFVADHEKKTSRFVAFWSSIWIGGIAINPHNSQFTAIDDTRCLWER